MQSSTDQTATDTLQFTLVRTPDAGRLATKTVVADESSPTGWSKGEAYRLPSVVEPYRVDVPADVDAVAEFLALLERAPRVCVVPGDLNPDTINGPIREAYTLDDVRAALDGEGEELRPAVQPTADGPTPNLRYVADPTPYGLIRRRYQPDENNTNHLQSARPGRRWLYVDVDGCRPPAWFVEKCNREEYNPADNPADLQRLAAHVRDTELPPEFAGVGCVYQFSSSAGVAPWTDEVRAHLVFILDRPAHFKSVRERFEGAGCLAAHGDVEGGPADGTVDRMVWTPTQPNYTAAPVFKSADGDELPDPLGENRSGVVPADGDAGDVVKVPDSVVDFADWTAREHEREKRRERRTRRRNGGELPDLPECPADADESAVEAARRKLNTVCDSLAATGEGNRHNALMRAAGYAFRLAAYIPADEIRDRLRGAGEFMFAGDDEPGEIASILADAARYAAGDDPIAIQGGETDGETPFDLYANATDTLDLSTARETLSQRLDECVADGLDASILAPPGTGKTYAVFAVALDVFADGGRVKLAEPTNELVEEKREEFIAYARDVRGWKGRRLEFLKSRAVVRPKRTADNCERFDFYTTTAPAVRNDGENTVCKSCPLYPSNDGPQCGFWTERLDYFEASPCVVFTTHALESLTGAGRRSVRVDWTGILDALDGLTVPYFAESGEASAPYLSPVVRVTEQGRTLTVEATPAGDGTRPETGCELPVELWAPARERARRERKEWRETVAENNGRHPAHGSPFFIAPMNVQDTPETRRAVVRWFADALDVQPADGESLEAAVRRAARQCESDALVERPFDLVALDESPASVIVPTVSVTLDGVKEWRRNGDVEFAGDVFADFLDAVSRLEPGGRADASTLDSHDLRELLPGESVSVVGDATVEAARETLRTAAREAADGDGTADAREILADAPPSSALDRLESVARAGWTGATLSVAADGTATIELPCYRELDRDQTDATVYLDATGCETTARVVLPDADARFELPVELPERVRVFQTDDWTASKHETFRPDRRHADRYSALFEAFESPETLHVVPKSWRRVRCEDTGQLLAELRGCDFSGADRAFGFGPLHTADRAGRVVHHNGVEARGSNRFGPEGETPCDTVLITGFYVPGAEIDALAERFAVALVENGEESADAGVEELFEECREAAEFQLQGASMLQTIGRVRPTLADEHGRDVTVVVADDRPPLPGLEPDARIDVDALALALGRPTVRSAGCVRSVLAPAVEAGGFIARCKGRNFEGVFEESAALDAGIFNLWHKTLIGSISETCQRLKNDLPTAAELPFTADDVFEFVRGFKSSGTGKSWTAVGEAAGFDVVEFRDDSGKSLALVESADDVTASSLADRLAELGCPARYVEFNGERAQVGRDELADALDRLAASRLDDVRRLAAGEFNKGETNALIADALDVSTSTARRRVLELDDGYSTLQRRAGRAAECAECDREACPLPFVNSSPPDEYASPYRRAESAGAPTAGPTPRLKSTADARAADDGGETPSPGDFARWTQLLEAIPPNRYTAELKRRGVQPGDDDRSVVWSRETLREAADAEPVG